MKFGCCTTMDNYDSLVRLGYDFIELAGFSVSAMSDEEFAKTRDKIKNGAIPCSGFNSYCTGDTPLIGKNFDLSVVDNYAKNLMARGGELGITNVGIGAPLARVLEDGFPFETAYEQMSQSITVICKHAKEHGINVLFEGLNHEMCKFIISTKDAVDFVNAHDIDNLHLVLDFYHLEVEGEGDDAALLALPLAKHVHISQRDPNQKRSYLRDECYESYEKQLGILKTEGYDGTLSIESSTDDFDSDAEKSLEILKKLFA